MGHDKIIRMKVEAVERQPLQWNKLEMLGRIQRQRKRQVLLKYAATVAVLACAVILSLEPNRQIVSVVSRTPAATEAPKLQVLPVQPEEDVRRVQTAIQQKHKTPIPYRQPSDTAVELISGTVVADQTMDTTTVQALALEEEQPIYPVIGVAKPLNPPGVIVVRIKPHGEDSFSPSVTSASSSTLPIGFSGSLNKKLN